MPCGRREKARPPPPLNACALMLLRAIEILPSNRVPDAPDANNVQCVGYAFESEDYPVAGADGLGRWDGNKQESAGGFRRTRFPGPGFDGSIRAIFRLAAFVAARPGCDLN